MTILAYLTNRVTNIICRRQTNNICLAEIVENQLDFTLYLTESPDSMDMLKLRLFKDQWIFLEAYRGEGAGGLTFLKKKTQVGIENLFEARSFHFYNF